ncbi:hypothetical protein Rumeso_03266 [Rubellimicrobium mesophilum DSM 19309]|uniref:Uncharacterized protein n=1 Tax=Rubellimicrobium mesophilum DSM 19309 TaxID=442562 RepID=A0A017HLH8_9RHOB|nr:hypothetical protein Rumeso_03266 [Rubellimicrobium mesophilum DSM 19309]
MGGSRQSGGSPPVATRHHRTLRRVRFSAPARAGSAAAPSVPRRAAVHPTIPGQLRSPQGGLQPTIPGPGRRPCGPIRDPPKRLAPRATQHPGPCRSRAGSTICLGGVASPYPPTERPVYGSLTPLPHSLPIRSAVPRRLPSARPRPQSRRALASKEDLKERGSRRQGLRTASPSPGSQDRPRPGPGLTAAERHPRVRAL